MNTENEKSTEVKKIPDSIKERIDEYDRNLDHWTYYELLYVPKNADVDAIKRAYRKIVSLMHPDKYGYNLDAEDKEKLERIFNEINVAYNTLTDESERLKYDQSLYYAESHGRPIKVDKDVQVAQAQYKRGMIALQKKDIDAAIGFFKSATELDGSNPEYFVRLAMALSSHKNPRVRKDAFAACKEAIKLNHENANYHALMGKLYQKEGELEEAEVHYRRALTWNPHHHLARKELRNVMQELKERKKAVGWKSKIMRFLGKKQATDQKKKTGK